jgi:hypothetical protein
MIGLILVAALLSPIILIPAAVLGAAVRKPLWLVAGGAAIALAHAIVVSGVPPTAIAAASSAASAALWVLLGRAVGRATGR